MPAVRRYSWVKMDTSPLEVLRALGGWRLGSGGLPPEEVNWAMTPQGARFWFKAFATGDKRAEAALARMGRQAQADLDGPADAPPAYDIARCGEVTTILLFADWMRTAQGPAYAGIRWECTPQGGQFWREYFAQSPSTRDPRPLEGFIAAARRFTRLEKLK